MFSRGREKVYSKGMDQVDSSEAYSEPSRWSTMKFFLQN